MNQRPLAPEASALPGCATPRLLVEFVCYRGRIVNEKSRSHLKKASNAQRLRCKPPQNAHILPCMLCFFIGLRLALERDLPFFKRLLSFLLLSNQKIEEPCSPAKRDLRCTPTSSRESSTVRTLSRNLYSFAIAVQTNGFLRTIVSSLAGPTDII